MTPGQEDVKVSSPRSLWGRGWIGKQHMKMEVEMVKTGHHKYK